jgi:hypothetical protein
VWQCASSLTKRKASEERTQRLAADVVRCADHNARESAWLDKWSANGFVFEYEDAVVAPNKRKKVGEGPIDKHTSTTRTTVSAQSSSSSASLSSSAAAAETPVVDDESQRGLKRRRPPSDRANLTVDTSSLTATQVGWKVAAVSSPVASSLRASSRTTKRARAVSPL